ncbi:MAG TPA: hypothetical protein V6D16_00440 [Candidatus Obscuribacterales bacterium]
MALNILDFSPHFSPPNPRSPQCPSVPLSSPVLSLPQRSRVSTEIAKYGGEGGLPGDGLAIAEEATRRTTIR